MESPFVGNDRAFEPMMDEEIAVRMKRNKDGQEVSLVQPLVVSFFQDSTAEPLSEGAFDTDREDVIIMCREADWGFVQKLQRGDVIERTSGKRYAVQKVQESSMMGYVIKARETE